VHYDELDHFYRDVWGDHVHHGLWLRGNESREEAVLQLVERVAAEGEITRGSRVCDIGCGYGAAAHVLAKRGAAVRGITVSPAQYGIAAQSVRGLENPAFILGDWQRNEFPDEVFRCSDCHRKFRAHGRQGRVSSRMRTASSVRAGGSSSARGLLPNGGRVLANAGYSSQFAAKAECRTSAARASIKRSRSRPDSSF
jgi:SAM-dependent methyltransferase